MERRQAATALRLLRNASPNLLTGTEVAAIELAAATLEAEPRDAWPKLGSPAKVGIFTFGTGLSARLPVEAAMREHDRIAAAKPQTIEEYRQTELDRRDAWDMLNGALVNGMAKDARRYVTWRTGLMSGGEKFVAAIAAALPSEVGDTREATPEEWDAALDLVAAPFPFAGHDPRFATGSNPENPQTEEAA